MKFGHKPEFLLKSFSPFIHAHELQDVIVVHPGQIVNLLLGVPRALIGQGKDLNGHLVIPAHATSPNRAESTASLDFQQLKRN